jgi:serpin B
VRGRLVLGLWLALAAGCAAAFDPSTMTGARQAANGFGFDLYAHAKEDARNFVCSPASAAVALTMVTAGARGQTLAEMAHVLHFQTDRPALAHESFAHLLASLNHKDGQDGLALRVVDRVWGQTGSSPRPEFLWLLAEHYQAPLQRVDFAGQTEAARRTINAWGAAATHDRIKEILPAGVVDPMTRLVVTNAVYFKGRWLRPFDSSLTRALPFHAAGGAVSTRMMTVTDTFQYAHVGDVAVAQLRYAGELSMIVVLPDTPTGLDAAEATAAASYDRWLARLEPRRIDVRLPRWAVTSKVALKEHLSAMGMPIAFSDAADFSGILVEGGVHITDVLQQAFVDVNEAGTEAAAVTAVVMGNESYDLPEPPPIPFHADRPFLYLIRDDTSGVILFVGRLVDPTAV